MKLMTQKCGGVQGLFLVFTKIFRTVIFDTAKV